MRREATNENCRPAQLQQRRHDRHMSLDMSSCRRQSVYGSVSTEINFNSN